MKQRAHHGQPRLMPLLIGATALLAALSAQAADQLIQVTNETGQAQAGVAVSVYVNGVKPTGAASTVSDMGQRHKAFVPRLWVIQTGTSVNFPNFDTVRHHVYSFSPARTFEIKLYAGTPAAPVVFDKAGTATLGCNIHDKMLAYIHVVNTPLFGVTDANGQLTLDLPAGEHRIRVWAPTMGEGNPGLEQPIKTAAGTVVVRIKP